METAIETDAGALLRAVLEAPGDDAPRLVYADWLEDHGEGDRAEFIRVQIDLETVRRTVRERGARAGPAAAYINGLADREWWLFRRNCGSSDLWFNDLPGKYRGAEQGGRITTADGYEYRTARGFVAAVRMPAAAFLGGGECEECGGMGWVDCQPKCPPCGNTGVYLGAAEGLFRSHPIEAVTLTDKAPQQWPPDIGGVGGAAGRWFWAVRTGDIPAGRYLPHYAPGELRDSAEWVSAKWYHDTPTYPTEAEALGAMSAAAVRYGRALVGLSSVAGARG